MENELIVKSTEIADFLRNIIKQFKSNPLLNLPLLSYAGMVLTSIGFIKNIDALKLLGDLISDAPEKLRSLIMLQYSVMGTLGEVQTMITSVTNEAIERVSKLLIEVVEMFEQGRIDNNKLIQILGELYELLVIRLPSVSVSVE